ncbi:hypothetical protein NHX12_009377 [Muraenolepis orangiensis]|uniref:Uncharacterized protein n=1 Tax=Muraenolepis orangiensis TaxID=630683 RepID=A0A9Q0I8X7_9TELE|nr:hypothetical protein NHX12_009377 [Muraenolepis orangiensis]
MLVGLAIVCILANILLLLPGFKFNFLLDGHVTREATWGTGIWSSGILVDVFPAGIQRSGPAELGVLLLGQCDRPGPGAPVPLQHLLWN